VAGARATRAFEMAYSAAETRTPHGSVSAIGTAEWFRAKRYSIRPARLVRPHCDPGWLFGRVRRRKAFLSPVVLYTWSVCLRDGGDGGGGRRVWEGSTRKRSRATGSIYIYVLARVYYYSPVIRTNVRFFDETQSAEKAPGQRIYVRGTGAGDEGFVHARCDIQPACYGKSDAGLVAAARLDARPSRGAT